jgi:enolase
MAETIHSINLIDSPVGLFCSLLYVSLSEDGFDEKDYEGWTRMTEAFAKEYPGFMIVRKHLSIIVAGISGSDYWSNRAHLSAVTHFMLLCF